MKNSQYRISHANRQSFMRRIYSIVLALVVGCMSMVAQTVVSGSVLSKSEGELAGATVFFVKSDSIVGGTITDSKGRFQLKELPAGDYECRVSMLGYKPASQKFTLTEKTKLPRFVLEEDAKALAEVTVTGDPRKMTKELAGMSIYYLTDRAKKEPDAYLALREIPRLRIKSDRNITLDDGSTPLILVNGVRKPLEVILPELIESVEVIDNPSARYRGDASVASVLNIKLKKAGIKPYLRGNMGAKATPNANFIFSNGSFELGDATSSIYVTGGYMQIAKNRSESYSDILQGNLHREESSKSKGSWRNPFVYIGGDKELSKKDYLAFSVKVYSKSEQLKKQYRRHCHRPCDRSVVAAQVEIRQPFTFSRGCWKSVLQTRIQKQPHSRDFRRLFLLDDWQQRPSR